MRNNHVTYIVAVWLNFSLFSWLWRQRQCQMQAATPVMPTESLIDWGLPGDLFIGLQCLKAKLVFRYERPDLFLLNFCHCSCKIHTRLSSFFSIAEQKHSSHWSNNWLQDQYWLITTLAYIYHSKLAWSACLHVVGLSFGIPCLTEQNDCLCIWIPHQRRAMLKMKETLVISLLICNLRAGSFLFTMAGHCNVMLHSLVPRPHARAREKVWLHKSKSLGPLQNLKASNAITKRHLLEQCCSEKI